MCMYISFLISVAASSVVVANIVVYVATSVDFVAVAFVDYDAIVVVVVVVVVAPPVVDRVVAHVDVASLSLSLYLSLSLSIYLSI